jgi:membrane-associated protease RseP (regulator of RpoE activity)
VHAGLFAVTCGTTTLAGGVEFAATLMTILVCHEMGHYIVARRHGIDASLPYFIPLPPGISLGTMGAVIRMRQTIDDRNKLIDVGAAGPIAGLVVAIPLLVYGLSISELGYSTGEGLVEGNSIAYVLLKLAVKGQYLPTTDGVDVMLHPIAFAAWVGLLITMINLIPIGQLDGGHIACAYLGDRHERFSRRLHVLLGVVGVGVIGVLSLDAYLAGVDVGKAINYAMAGAPWLFWALLLVVLRRLSGGIYHPPVGDKPLSTKRRWLVFSMAVVFLLIFTPVPLRPILP